jgi:hypothetical protein
MPMSIAAVVLFGFVPRVFTNGLGWWWILAVPLVLTASFFFAVAVNYILAFVEWSLVLLKKCPNCGSRHWSWGYNSGFGL